MSYQEYAMIIIKPDGNNPGFIRFLQRYLSTLGLKIVYTRNFQLTESHVDELFPSEFNTSLYKSYLTQDVVKAMLVIGDSAYDKVLENKYVIRNFFKINENQMKNLIHSPEAGNEYTKLLELIFPDIKLSMHSLSFDAYARGNFKPNVNEMNTIRVNAVSTNADIIYVFNTDELSNYQPEMFSNMIKMSNRALVYGIEYQTFFNDLKFNIIGYYNCKNLDKYQRRYNIPVTDASEVIKSIVNFGGVPSIGYSNDRFIGYPEIFTDFWEIGIKCVLCYHPNYQIQDTKYLRKNAFNNGMRILGGSGGASYYGSYAISYKMFYEAFATII